MRRRDKDGRLKPLTLSARLSLLRAHGVHQVDREESAAIEIIQVSPRDSQQRSVLTPTCVLRLVELRSRAVTAKKAATPRPAPALSTKLVAKLTRRGFLVNALQETVPILREGKSTIVRRSKFTGI